MLIGQFDHLIKIFQTSPRPQTGVDTFSEEKVLKLMMRMDGAGAIKIRAAPSTNLVAPSTNRIITQRVAPKLQTLC